MAQLNELFNLGLAIVLGPLLYLNRRGVPSEPGYAWYASGVGLMAGAYVVTILEGYLLPDLLNVVEHSLIAGAGIAFIVGLRHSWNSSPPRRVTS